jgi:hypothetical protein
MRSRRIIRSCKLSMRYVENDVCVCGVWSVLCFNFVTAQKYIGLEREFKELHEDKQTALDRMTLVCVVCVVCAVCVWCVRYNFGVSHRKRRLCRRILTSIKRKFSSWRILLRRMRRAQRTQRCDECWCGVCGVCVCDFWRFTQEKKKLDDEIVRLNQVKEKLAQVCHIAVAVMSVIMYGLT